MCASYNNVELSEVVSQVGQVARGGVAGGDLPSTTSVTAAAYPTIARATTPIIKFVFFFSETLEVLRKIPSHVACSPFVLKWQLLKETAVFKARELLPDKG